MGVFLDWIDVSDLFGDPLEAVVFLGSFCLCWGITRLLVVLICAVQVVGRMIGLRPQETIMVRVRWQPLPVVQVGRTAGGAVCLRVGGRFVAFRRRVL